MKLGNYILLLLVILSLSTNWIIMKVGLSYISDIWYVGVRLLAASIIVIVWMALRKTLVMPAIKDIPMIVIVGLLQMGFYLLFMTIGLNYSTASGSAILCYTTPLWVAPIAFAVFKEKMSVAKITGMALGLLGIAVYFALYSFNLTAKHTLAGSLFALSSSLCFATAILYAKYGKWHKSPIQLFPWQLLISAVFVVSVAFILHPHITISYNATLLFALSYSTIIATIFSFWGIIRLSCNLPATLTSISFLFVPVLTVFLASIFLHEQIKINVIVAMVLIFAGILLILRGTVVPQKQEV